MRQSADIILQSIHSMPLGDIINDDLKLNVSKNMSKYYFMESTIDHFKYFSLNLTVPEGDIYVASEAPKGEFGVYLCCDHTDKPQRCKIKAPGFLHLQGLEFMTKGAFLADLVTNIGTQDIVFGEIDR